MHQLKVFVYDLEHARAQHLDRDFALLTAAVFQAGEMHLRNRCAGHRHPVKAAENFIHTPAEGAFNRSHRHIRGEWRHLVLQLGQFIGDVVGQQVAPGRQHLAEFDKNRA